MMKTENVFDAVRGSVTARQAAESAGIYVNRSGMAVCPFHDDRNPSMKFYGRRFHCFGCQADGDAVDFTARFYGIPIRDAAEKLADMFMIPYDGSTYHARDRPVPMGKPPEKALRSDGETIREYQKAESRCFNTLCDYLHLLKKWKKEYAPESPGQEIDSRFLEACRRQDYVEYILDDVFLSGTLMDRAGFIRDHGKEILELERRIYIINKRRTGHDPESGRRDHGKAVPAVGGSENGVHGGTYIFAGSPKIGKSFFMAQVGYHVAKGIPLWNYPVRQGNVLYLALEDDYARLQGRLSMMFGVETVDGLHFATRSRTIDDGLIQQLEQFLLEHPDTRLIIVDTLQKVRDSWNDSYSYSADYQNITALKEFSDNRSVAVLVVHHTRKMEASDSFDMISGTNGLLGAADGAFILIKKKRTDNEATMQVVGRDQEDQVLTLEFNRDRCVWELKKVEKELRKKPVDEAITMIAAFIKKEGQWEGTATQLLSCLPGLDLKPNVLTRKLNVGNSVLFNEFNISYSCWRSGDKRTIRLSYGDSCPERTDPEAEIRNREESTDKETETENETNTLEGEKHEQSTSDRKADEGSGSKVYERGPTDGSCELYACG